MATTRFPFPRAAGPLATAAHSAVAITDPGGPQVARFVPRRLLALGFVGSALMAMASVGAGAILQHDPLVSSGPLAWVRYGHGRELATLVLYIGLGLLIWAWVRLGRAVRARVLGARAVLACLTAWTVPLVFAPPLFSKDIYSYLAQGQVALHGFDPYKVGPSVLSGPIAENVSWVWQHTPAPYGPLFVLMAKATAAVTGQQIIPGVILIRLFMLPGLVLMAWALPKLARVFGGRGDIALWFGAANPLMLVHLVGGGHNDLPMVGFMMVGCVLVLHRRPISGFAMVTVGVAIKASAVLVLPFLVWVWAGRLRGPAWWRFIKAAVGGMVTVAVVFAALTLLAGVDLGWVSALSGSSAIVNWLSIPTAIGQSMDTVSGWFTNLPDGLFTEILRAIGEVVLVVIAVWQWWRARVGGPEAVRRACLVLLVFALFGPTSLPWYFTWSIALGAGFAYSGAGLVAITATSLWLVLVTYPSGDTALYDWWYVFCAAALAALGALSLVRLDPLGLSVHDADRLLAKDRGQPLPFLPGHRGQVPAPPTGAGDGPSEDEHRAAESDSSRAANTR